MLVGRRQVVLIQLRRCIDERTIAPALNPLARCRNVLADSHDSRVLKSSDMLIMSASR